MIIICIISNWLRLIKQLQTGCFRIPPSGAPNLQEHMKFVVEATQSLQRTPGISQMIKETSGKKKTCQNTTKWNMSIIRYEIWLTLHKYHEVLKYVEIRCYSVWSFDKTNCFDNTHVIWKDHLMMPATVAAVLHKMLSWLHEPTCTGAVLEELEKTYPGSPKGQSQAEAGRM